MIAARFILNDSQILNIVVTSDVTSLVQSVVGLGAYTGSGW